MSDERVYNLMEEHRRETREHFSRLEDVLVQLSNSTSQLAISTALMEERYRKTDKEMGDLRDALREATNRISQNEREIAEATAKAAGGWKTLTVLGATMLGSMAVINFLFRYLGAV